MKDKNDAEPTQEGRVGNQKVLEQTPQSGVEDVTGRDNMIIAQALYFASKALRARERPPFSDIEDMEAILDVRFHEFRDMYDVEADLKRAIRLGMKIDGN